MKEYLEKAKKFLFSKQALIVLIAFLAGVAAHSCWNNSKMINELKKGNTTEQNKGISSSFGCCRGD